MKFRFFNLTVISISALKHTTDFTCKINFHDISQKHNFSHLKFWKCQFHQLTDSFEIRLRMNISTSEITLITSTNHHSQIHKHFHDIITTAISFSKSNLQINEHFHDMIIITVNCSRNNMLLKHYQHKKHII